MPQCVCGRHFTQTSYDLKNKESDLCPKCRDASTPKSYINSIEWDCEDVTGILIDMNNYFGAFSNDQY